MCEECAEEAEERGWDNMTSFWRTVRGYALDHQVPIKKFGRYPTRNQALGREDTPEVKEFLKTAESWG